MQIGELCGYQLYAPESGGKAGKGGNISTSLQVRQFGLIVKQFRFVLSDAGSRQIAIDKAKSLFMNQLQRVSEKHPVAYQVEIIPIRLIPKSMVQIKLPRSRDITAIPTVTIAKNKNIKKPIALPL
jgi:hypothetical protein